MNKGDDKIGFLSFMELEGAGPARKLRVGFSERLNLITGDNGLGKTFILENAWRVLSGDGFLSARSRNRKISEHFLSSAGADCL